MAFDNFRGRTLAPETAANGIDVSVSQVHRWIKSGQIKAIKLGYRMTRIDGDSLADFLTSRMSEPRPPRGKAAAKHTLSELAAQA
ncbi:MAG: helix-turn-helix domain-containing protein [Betaproteobacteria bacterium]|nr:helix-turn-helix domain-containing protein [Betaproteobacteria bacterium]